MVSPTVEEEIGGRVPAAGTVPGAGSVPGAAGGSVPGSVGAGAGAVPEGWLVGASVLPHSVSVTVTVELMYSDISLAHTGQNQTSLSDVLTTRVTIEQTSGQNREMVNYTPVSLSTCQDQGKCKTYGHEQRHHTQHGSPQKHSHLYKKNCQRSRSSQKEQKR